VTLFTEEENKRQNKKDGIERMKEMWNEDTSKALKRCNYLFGEIDRVYHEISLKLGLSDSAMKILYTICDNGSRCLLQNVCRQSGLSKQTVNSALRKLETEGFVYLESVSSKNKRVCLTETGKRLGERTAGRLIEAENAIFASWSREDVEKYLSLTEMFLKDLENRAKNM
jgi:DNA-binding MarR family transcriptional regulator